MGIPIIGDIIHEIGATVREIIPDADKRLELQSKLDDLENQLLLGQIDVNKEEAKSSNIFVAGWRPFIGWVGGVSLGYTWVLAPLLQWFCGLVGHPVALPAIAPAEIYPIILALLGIGGMRTYEKTKGVASSIGGVVYTPTQPTTTKVENQVQTQETPSVPLKRKRWF